MPPTPAVKTNAAPAQQAYSIQPVAFKKPADGLAVASPEALVVPTSKKVLMIDAIGGLTAPEQCIQKFKEQGWTEEDITLKEVTDPLPSGYYNIKPEDFFNLADYGIFLYFGHGHSYRAGESAVGLEQGIYLDGCYIDQDQINRAPYNLWLQKFQIVITGSSTLEGVNSVRPADQQIKIEEAYANKKWYFVIIRGDLLREQMTTLPSTDGQMATCYSTFFASIY